MNLNIFSYKFVIQNEFCHLLCYSDNLRELCSTFRSLLHELAKCVSVCENDVNVSLVDDLFNKYGILQSLKQTPSKSRPLTPNEQDLNQSTCSSIGNRSMRISLVPDVSGILSLIEDPSLVSFVTEKLGNDDALLENEFNVGDCMEKLKLEVDILLQISEKLNQTRVTDNKDIDEKNKSIEEEDGLKGAKDDFNVESTNTKQRLSLPIFLPVEKANDLNRKTLTHSDLNDLKNRLVLAETKNNELEKKLAEVAAQKNELEHKLKSYQDSQSEELSEG